PTEREPVNASTEEAKPGSAVDRARRLAPTLRAAAEESEACATMPDRVVKLIGESGLFGLMVPTELGGDGADIVTGILAIEELCRAESSIGWSYMANMVLTAYLAAY